MAAYVVFVAPTSITFAAPCRSQGMLSRAILRLQIEGVHVRAGVSRTVSPRRIQRRAYYDEFVCVGACRSDWINSASPVGHSACCGLRWSQLPAMPRVSGSDSGSRFGLLPMVEEIWCHRGTNGSDGRVPKKRHDLPERNQVTMSPGCPASLGQFWGWTGSSTRPHCRDSEITSCSKAGIATMMADGKKEKLMWWRRELGARWGQFVSSSRHELAESN